MTCGQGGEVTDAGRAKVWGRDGTLRMIWIIKGELRFYCARQDMTIKRDRHAPNVNGQTKVPNSRDEKVKA